jgi:hypothetical protein
MPSHKDMSPRSDRSRPGLSGHGCVRTDSVVWAAEDDGFAVRLSLLTRFFMTAEALKTITRRGDIGASTPVFGFRPIRLPFWRTWNAPNDDSLTVSPLTTLSEISFNTSSTTPSFVHTDPSDFSQGFQERRMVVFVAVPLRRFAHHTIESVLDMVIARSDFGEVSLDLEMVGKNTDRIANAYKRIQERLSSDGVRPPSPDVGILELMSAVFAAARRPTWRDRQVVSARLTEFRGR